mmetsp:Transcript_130145/g.376529  ORF Transcript_130145/g.376529 Transcript_130145/m.376529 type:complete len:132 (-) Transcript_130145:87-482(-)
MQCFTDEQIAEFKEAWSMVDKGGNGTMSTKDLGKLMRSIGWNPSKSELDAIINEVDTDGNRTIDFPAFLAVMACKMILGVCSNVAEARLVLENSEEKFAKEVDEVLCEAGVDGDDGSPINYLDFVKVVMTM